MGHKQCESGIPDSHCLCQSNNKYIATTKLKLKTSLSKICSTELSMDLVNKQIQTITRYSLIKENNRYALTTSFQKQIKCKSRVFFHHKLEELKNKQNIIRKN